MSRVSTINTILYKDHLFENLSLLSYFRSFEFGPTSQIWGDFFPRKWIMIFLMPTKSALYKTAVVQIVNLPYLLFFKTDQDHCKNCTVIFCINLYLFPFFKRLQIKNDLCYNLSGCNVNNHRYFYGVMYLLRTGQIFRYFNIARALVNLIYQVVG